MSICPDLGQIQTFIPVIIPCRKVAYNVYPAHTQPNRATNDSGLMWV